MNKKYLLLALFSGLLTGTTAIYAQSNIITTLAGTGISGYTGDGGAATSADLNQVSRVIVDAAGNKYIADAANNRIRKISSTGIITTIVGNGTAGFSGDGGSASSASVNAPDGLALDASGNLYIADQNNYRIRMVNTSGIINTVAGNGLISRSGDGGPATSAGIGQPGGVAIDNLGNLYIVGMTNVVRKVNTSGVISTIAGNGTAGFSGDGGAATAAELHQPWGIAVDALYNIYVADWMNNRIRKIDPSGIITTIAGTGTAAFSGDGGPATAANLQNPEGITLDPAGNLFFCDRGNNVVRQISTSGDIFTIAGTSVSGFSGDGGPATAALLSGPTGIALDHSGILYFADEYNDRVRKFSVGANYSDDSFKVYIGNNCGGADFTIVTTNYASGMSIQSSYGDGGEDTNTIASGLSGFGGYANFSHTYATTGTYTVKQVLLEGGIAVDSISYTYNYKMCNTIVAYYYVDNNSDCIFESGIDNHVFLPITAEIDSNGVVVDTIVSPGGFYYRAYGSTGDIYTVRIISEPPGLTLTCPSTGILYDTLATTSSFLATDWFAMNCSSLSGFDLSIHAANRAGRHAFMSDVIVENYYCTPKPATVNIDLSPKYNYNCIDNPPTSTSGSDLTWNFAGLSSTDTSNKYMHIMGAIPTGLSWYLPGDTANSSFVVDPISGDADTTNNEEIHLDTITSSFDPNYISVKPDGCITSAVTNLEYGIGFENTGNDTAHNIYILDTLSPYLDVNTLQVVAASANMNVMKLKNGTQNIIKFDFPHIMLPDSSHTGYANGVIFFTINTKAGIASGSNIPNEAGIYFDDNPVVLTNTALNTVNCPITTQVAATGNKIKTAIYPNPATFELTITTDQGAYNSFTITNAIGQVMMGEPISNTETDLNIKSLPSGLYYVNLKGDSGAKVLKFVKM